MNQEEINQIRRELEKDLREKQEKAKIKNRQKLFIFGVFLMLIAPALLLGGPLEKENTARIIYCVLIFVFGLISVGVSTEGMEKLPFNI